MRAVIITVPDDIGAVLELSLSVLCARREIDCGEVTRRREAVGSDGSARKKRWDAVWGVFTTEGRRHPVNDSMIRVRFGTVQGT